jgi:hypothetical protein
MRRPGLQAIDPASLDLATGGQEVGQTVSPFLRDCWDIIPGRRVCADNVVGVDGRMHRGQYWGHTLRIGQGRQGRSLIDINSAAGRRTIEVEARGDGWGWIRTQ